MSKIGTRLGLQDRLRSEIGQLPRGRRVATPLLHVTPTLMANARATLRSVADSSGLEVPAGEVSSRSGVERRTNRRVTPTDLRNTLVARYRHGESVSLIDLSIGGAQFETPRLVRPDADVVLEIVDSRTREVSEVVAHVLRANVSGLTDGITYRAACAFKRPLSHPTLLVPAAAPARASGPHDLKLDLELKAIFDAHFKRSRAAYAVGRPDPSSLLEALVRLRTAAECRPDPTDRQLGVLLAAMIPALQRREPTDAVVRKLHNQLAGQLPLRALRTNTAAKALAQDCESITLNLCADANRAPLAITAEFPAGFGLDASQFRLLKLSAYLVGLIESWNSLSVPAAPTASMLREPEEATGLPVAAETDARPGSLPHGWHRVVVRYTDGRLLHGFSNDFHPSHACFQFSPSVGCPAGERLMVPIARLKAVFFVKDLQGDQNRVDAQMFDHAPRGRKVQLTFRDGEVMTGSTLGYKPNEQGFFVVPADSRGNNLRAYVVTAAIRHIRII
jgi:hypothetical protein